MHDRGPDPVDVLLDLGVAESIVDLLADSRYEAAEAGRPLRLEGGGFRWLRATGAWSGAAPDLSLIRIRRA